MKKLLLMSTIMTFGASAAYAGLGTILQSEDSIEGKLEAGTRYVASKKMENQPYIDFAQSVLEADMHEGKEQKPLPKKILDVFTGKNKILDQKYETFEQRLNHSVAPLPIDSEGKNQSVGRPLWEKHHAVYQPLFNILDNHGKKSAYRNKLKRKQYGEYLDEPYLYPSAKTVFYLTLLNDFYDFTDGKDIDPKERVAQLKFLVGKVDKWDARQYPEDLFEDINARWGSYGGINHLFNEEIQRQNWKYKLKTDNPKRHQENQIKRRNLRDELLKLDRSKVKPAFESLQFSYFYGLWVVELSEKDYRRHIKRKLANFLPEHVDAFLAKLADMKAQTFE